MRHDLREKTIGNIRIEAMLGRGGMGEVYRGFDQKLERWVAVKTIRTDQALSPDARARFLREARILSRLEHPAICQVYDLIEGDGTDYLIFEYVEGETLERRAATRRLTEREILELGEKIAHGLAAAHKLRIVHRDLKPGNVMVMPDGAIKILDFGISRAVREHGREGEQVASDPDDGVAPPLPDATAASRRRDTGGSVGADWEDIHAEPKRPAWADPALATARMPLPTAPSDATAAGAPTPPTRGGATAEGETQRMPTAPATSHGTGITHTLDADLTEYGLVIGTARYMSPEQAYGEEITEAADLYALGILLQELLTGEPAYPDVHSRGLLLDVAQARTLPLRGVDPDVAQLVDRLKSRDPAARPTAAQAAAGFRFILDKPKRLQRQRIQRLVAAGVAVVMTAVAAVVSVLAVQASRQAERANQEAARATAEANRANLEAERATAEARRAQEVADFLIELFDEANPDVSGGKETTARDLVDRGAARLDRELEAQPLVRAGLQETLAKVYLRLARYQDADRLAREAYTARSKALPANHVDLGGSLYLLGNVDAELGRTDEAEAHLREAIAIYQTADDPAGLGDANNSLGTLLFEQGRFDEAQQAYDQAIGFAERPGNDRSKLLADALNNSAVLAWTTGNLAEAERRYRRALGIIEAAVGPRHPRLAPLLNNLGIVYREQGKLAEAGPMHARALAIATAALGPEHPEVGLIHFSIGRLALASDDLEAARRAFERSLAVQSKSRGSAHYETQRSRVQLADVHRRLGQAERAHQLLAPVLASLDEEQPMAVEALQVAGDVARDLGRTAQAATHYRRGIPIAEAFYGADDARTRRLRDALSALAPPG